MKQITLVLFVAALIAPATLRLAAQSSATVTASVTTPPCNNNGVISVTVTGMTPPISYTYSNWLANINIVHTAVNSVNDALTGVPALQAQWGNANSWLVMASDGTNFALDSVTVMPPFTYSINVATATCPSPNTLQAFTIGGNPPFTYLWTNMTNNSTYNTNPALGSHGQYTLVVTDNSGCVVSVPTGSGSIWAIGSSGISLNFSGSPANCTNGTATVVASGGQTPYSYQWSNNATSQSINNLTWGSYNVLVTDNQGCVQQGFYFVPQAVTINYNSTITQPTCLQNNGAVTSFVNGGTPPYTFLWSNSATTQNLTNVTAGSYGVVITDANNCTRNAQVFLSASTPITVNYITSASSCTAATGSATLTANGGTAPYNIVWYTFPANTTGASITAKPPGTYSFKVTDAVGCIQTGGAVISPASTINANISASQPVCPSTSGNVSVGATGTNPPFTYLWSNAATTSGISGVPLGAYSCTITDIVGCKVTKSTSLHQTSPVNINLNSNNVACLYDTNGSIVALATGGTAPYSYQWSNSVTAPANTGLGVGQYWVTATDANGCKKSKMGTVGNNATSNSCYCTITGTVYIDMNSNCTRDAGENGVPNIQVHCSGIGYAYTNSNGVYSFQVPTGAYTINETIHQLYPLSPCQGNNISVTVTAGPNCVSTVNFANNVVPLSDLRVTIMNNNLAIPGNAYSQRVVVTNDGTINENAIKLGYLHDGQLSFSNSTPWALTQLNSISYPNWYSIPSGFPSLSPAGTSSTTITYNVPTNIPLQTLVNFKDSVAKNAPISTQWLTDNTPWNNVNSHNVMVVGSYDPNFKEVSPQGVGATGDILHRDSVLTYVVHFQNEGSYFAQNVVVIDSLDANLNIKSMKPGYSDHVFSTTMTDNGVAKFSFENIRLPWKSAYGDALSSGVFMYTVKLKAGLPLGTQIKNKAAIYFDFNEPIITNTTLNTLAKPTATTTIESYRLPGDNALLFPNPADDEYTLVVVSARASSGTLKVFDLNGRAVAAQDVRLEAGINSIRGESSNLANGIYIVQLRSDEMQVSRKLTVNR